MNDSHTIESDSMPDLLQAPRLKSRAINESTGIMQSSHSGVGLSGCQMMRQNITAASLAALGSHMDPSNSCGEICLEGESFLQSLESISMPTVAQQASEIGPYAPVSAFQNLYANMNESDDKHNTAAMQHEILNAWGASGPPTNGTAYLHANSGISYMHMPYDANQALGSAPRRAVRGGRGRGRGRGLRKRLMQNVLGPSSHLSFGPNFLPILHDMRGRDGMPASAQTHYIPKDFGQVSKSQTPQDNSGLMLSGIVTQKRDLNADSIQTCEDSLVNEKMDAYIEKFSTDSSMDTVEPLIPIDRSQKPNTLSEAIGMYIDYLIRENEKKTHISSCSVAHVPLDLHKEDYYQQVMCRPVSFPTNKFRDWLKLYDVDIEITDPDGQTVSQTTFSPSGDFTDVHASAATSVSLLNWQTHGDGADQQSVSPGPCFNMEAAVRRFRNRGRVAVGHFQQCPHYSSVVTMANYPAGCNQNGLPADSQFQRNDLNTVRTVTSYPHGIAQFKTIRVPALEAMRYLNQAPTGNLPVPLSSFTTSPYHQTNGRFQAPAPAKSNYYRMATVLNAANMPYDKEVGSKGVPLYPGVLVSDMKPADAGESEGYDEAVSMQNRGHEAMTTANRNLLIPPISSMLTSFHNSCSGFNGSSNFQTESDPGYVHTQLMDRTCRANEGDDVLPEPRSKSALADCSVEPDTAITSMPLTLKSENMKNVNIGIDLECQYPAADPLDNDLGWNTALTSSRPDNVPVLREMVDQSIQTENDEIEGTHIHVCNGTRIKIKCELQDGTLSQNMSGFSYDGMPEYCGKVEEQLSSDVLLRNASVILNGTLEMDESGTFPCQELLTNSQISGFEFDALGQLETCGVQSCVLTDSPCNNETREKAETPGALIVRCEVDDSVNQSATEPVLDVASNVEINSEDIQRAEENSESITEWSDAIPCKRSRFVADVLTQSSLECPAPTHI